MTDAHARTVRNFHSGGTLAREIMRSARPVALAYIAETEPDFLRTPTVLRAVTRLACLCAIARILHVRAAATEFSEEFCSRCDEAVRRAAVDVTGEARLALTLTTNDDFGAWNRFVDGTLATVVSATAEAERRVKMDGIKL